MSIEDLYYGMGPQIPLSTPTNIFDVANIEGAHLWSLDDRAKELQALHAPTYGHYAENTATSYGWDGPSVIQQGDDTFYLQGFNEDGTPRFSSPSTGRALNKSAWEQIAGSQGFSATSSTTEPTYNWTPNEQFSNAIAAALAGDQPNAADVNGSVLADITQQRIDAFEPIPQWSPDEQFSQSIAQILAEDKPNAADVNGSVLANLTNQRINDFTPTTLTPSAATAAAPTATGQGPTQEQANEFFDSITEKYRNGELTPEQVAEYETNFSNPNLTEEQRQYAVDSKLVNRLANSTNYLSDNRGTLSDNEFKDGLEQFLIDARNLETAKPEQFQAWVDANPEMAVRYFTQMTNPSNFQGQDIDRDYYKTQAAQTAYNIGQEAGFGPDGKEDGSAIAYQYDGPWADINSEFGQGDFWKIGTKSSLKGGLKDFVEDNPFETAAIVASMFFAPQLANGLVTAAGAAGVTISPLVSTSLVNGALSTIAAGGDLGPGLITALGTYGLGQLAQGDFLDSVFEYAGVDPAEAQQIFQLAEQGGEIGEAGAGVAGNVLNPIQAGREFINQIEDYNDIDIPNPGQIAAEGVDTTPPEIPPPQTNNASIEGLYNQDGSINEEAWQEYLGGLGVDIDKLPGVVAPGDSAGGGASAEEGTEGEQSPGEASPEGGTETPAEPGGGTSGLPPELEEATIDSNAWWVVVDGVVYTRDFENDGWKVDEEETYKGYGVDPTADGQYYDNGQPVQEEEVGSIVITPPIPPYDVNTGTGGAGVPSGGGTGTGAPGSGTGVIITPGTGTGTRGDTPGTGGGNTGDGDTGTGNDGDGPGSGDTGDGGGQIPDGGPGPGPGTGDEGPGPDDGEPGPGGDGDGDGDNGDEGDGDSTGALLQALMAILGIPGRKSQTVKQGVAEIGDPYDFVSIFGNTKANNGKVNNNKDAEQQLRMLQRILRGG